MVWHALCVVGVFGSLGIHVVSGLILAAAFGFDCKCLWAVVEWFVVEFVALCVECLVCFWLSGASFPGSCC